MQDLIGLWLLGGRRLTEDGGRGVEKGGRCEPVSGQESHRYHTLLLSAVTIV